MILTQNDPEGFLRVIFYAQGVDEAAQLVEMWQKFSTASTGLQGLKLLLLL